MDNWKDWMNPQPGTVGGISAERHIDGTVYIFLSTGMFRATPLETASFVPYNK